MRRTTQNGTTTIGSIGTRKTADSDHSKTLIGRSLIFNITILTQLHVVDWAGKGKLRKKHYGQSHGHGAPATNSIYYVSLGFIHNNINARHYTITDDDYPHSAPP